MCALPAFIVLDIVIWKFICYFHPAHPGSYTRRLDRTTMVLFSQSINLPGSPVLLQSRNPNNRILTAAHKQQEISISISDLQNITCLQRKQLINLYLLPYLPSLRLFWACHAHNTCDHLFAQRGRNMYSCQLLCALSC